MSAMSVAAAILQDHPLAVQWSETGTAVVAVASFIWAGRYVRSAPPRPSKKRMDAVEGLGKVTWICNPGRRSSDRCAACPLDKTCLKHLPPLDDAERARDKATVSAVSFASQHRPQIVFVDDNDALCLVVEVLLTDAGYGVRLAKGFLDAVPFQPGEKLLITDWRLGEDYTGGEIIRAFRETNHLRSVLVVSALDSPAADMPESVTWMRKPFDPDKFVATVAALLAAP